jgi:hypothetical protein
MIKIEKAKIASHKRLDFPEKPRKSRCVRNKTASTCVNISVPTLFVSASRVKRANLDGPAISKVADASHLTRGQPQALGTTMRRPCRLANVA